MCMITLCKYMYFITRYMYMMYFVTVYVHVYCVGKASDEIAALVSDNGLWRELCICHFSQQQLHNYIQTYTKLRQQQHKEMSWYRAYTKLYRYVYR